VLGSKGDKGVVVGADLCGVTGERLVGAAEPHGADAGEVDA
jgi:hypothetical protein